jgi:hypothetical protein
MSKRITTVLALVFCGLLPGCVKGCGAQPTMKATTTSGAKIPGTKTADEDPEGFQKTMQDNINEAMKPPKPPKSDD